MSLQPAVTAARAREPRSRASHRYIPCCQVRGCRARACMAVEIELPAAWEASAAYTVLAVTLGACREHARELQLRAVAVLQARADLRDVLAVIEAAAIGGERS